MLRQLRGLLRQVVARLRAWTAWVWARITGEPGYAEALAELAVAIADLFLRDDGVRRLVHRAARALSVTIRSLLRDQDSSPGSPWDDTPEWGWA